VSRSVRGAAAGLILLALLFALGAAPLVALQPVPAGTPLRESSPERELPPTRERLEWAPFDRGLPSSGQWRESFALADFDGDGRLDLVSGPPRKAVDPVPVVFLGDGAGGWRRWGGASFPPIGYAYGAAAAGDLDGDGHTDLALGMHLDGAVVLLGDGRGGFRTASEGIERGGASAFSTVALRIVDWDADGRGDIVALGEGPTPARVAPAAGSRGVRWYRNLGGGEWQGSDLSSGASAGVFGRSLVVADFDADGKPDVALGSRRLGERRLVAVHGPGGGLAPRFLAALPQRALVETVAAADLDRDGRLDLVVGYRRQGSGTSWESGVAVLVESLHRTVPLLLEPGRSGILALAVGDVDGDGALDVAAGGGDGRLWIFTRDAEGRFVRDRSPGVGAPVTGCRVSALELADLDGDGRSELLAGFAANSEECPGDGALRAWRAQVPDAPGRGAALP